MKKQTIAINNPFVRPDVYGALAVPVYNNVAFEFDDAAVMADAFCNRIKAPDYARVENPTVTNFEERVKALTGAAHVTAFNSGMAAISNTLLAVAEQNRNIVSSHHLFGNTLALLTNTLKRFGVEARLRNLTNLEAVADAIDEQTTAVFLEVVTNPQLEVADLKAIAEIAHQKGVPVIADSTVIPFTETHLKALGIDIEVVSSTKYLSGGGTSLGGLVIDYGTFPDINKRVKYDLLFNLGAYMTPQAAYMQTLGLETLDVRYQRQASNALWLAQELSRVVKVNYVGLESNPYHALAQQQFGKTAGAMLTIDLESKEACFRFLNRLRLVHRATNLFDSRTLAIHPASTIFGNFSEEQLKEMDVRQTTIRLSVGLEDREDILADIKQALEREMKDER
ncbi:aminotransferase class V-fold PLP-dependent enzyme [Prevotella sp. E13-17]|uniref:trans-sulfuration enzyme family protein n=1 Tax=Prevotella sp. E13-17 TaxID=2913616 RepID=UPI001EDB816E|nr:aminotransferase class V-fold PLP-dependent enzyme [Prevotella sp. E13-17]UKK51546.1 aminotransferase class V-fold PLP-dependent enzyme [Prevotella sp. E13-17]